MESEVRDLRSDREAEFAFLARAEFNRQNIIRVGGEILTRIFDAVFLIGNMSDRFVEIQAAAIVLDRAMFEINKELSETRGAAATVNTFIVKRLVRKLNSLSTCEAKDIGAHIAVANGVREVGCQKLDAYES